jgi:hypothetical protein
LDCQLRCPAEPVRELIDDEVDLSLGAPARIAIAAFEKEDEIVALAVNAIEIISAEVLPLIVEFTSKMLPLCSQNILVH